jgi:methionine-rich copper-binding protein CopC
VRLFLAAATALNLILPFTALAHAILVDSTPREDAVIFDRNIAVELAFNSRVDQSRSTLTLEGPDHDSTPVVVAKDSAQPPKLSARVSDLKPGLYKLHWQVLAIDGHITRGMISFSVR